REPLPTQPLQHLEAVQSGQSDVEHHQVELITQRQLQRLGPGGRDRGAVARGAQALLDEGGDPGLVLGDQDRGHGLSCSVPGSIRTVGSWSAGPPARGPVVPGPVIPGPVTRGPVASGPSSAGRAAGSSGPDSAVITGRSRVKVEPRPGRLSGNTRPRWAWAIAATMASPSPDPSD